MNEINLIIIIILLARTNPFTILILMITKESIRNSTVKYLKPIIITHEKQ